MEGIVEMGRIQSKDQVLRAVDKKSAKVTLEGYPNLQNIIRK